jgi:glycosyltransferase involved in cell wall biosynthesis
MKKVLFISYDGMTDPLGQSQVIPYLKGLTKNGYQITLLSFEKKEKLAKLSSHIQSILDQAGIKWETVLFTRKPPILSKLYDVWKLKRKVRQLHAKQNFNFIHCRSYVAAEAGWEMRRRFGVPFLFDMRGFWVDERVDNGQWNLSNPFFRFFYRHYKKKEKVYFRNASHVISLTWKGKEELVNKYDVPAEKINVIPCCVDLEHFDYNKVSEKEIQEKRASLGLSKEDVVITYLGSLGGWYLVKEMMDFFAEMKKKVPAAKFLFITQDSPTMIYQAAAASNINTNNILVQPALRNEVPLYLSLGNYSIFFIKDAYSKRASSPTKQGEIMAMGIPLICNDIGDTGKIVEASGAGILVKEFVAMAYQGAVEKLPYLLSIDKKNIRKAAFEYYDLANGVSAYAEVYKRLTSN